MKPRVLILTMNAASRLDHHGDGGSPLGLEGGREGGRERAGCTVVCVWAVRVCLAAANMQLPPCRSQPAGAGSCRLLSAISGNRNSVDDNSLIVIFKRAFNTLG